MSLKRHVQFDLSPQGISQIGQQGKIIRLVLQRFAETLLGAGMIEAFGKHHTQGMADRPHQRSALVRRQGGKQVSRFTITRQSQG